MTETVTVNGGRRVWLYAGDSTIPSGGSYSWRQTAGAMVGTILDDPFGEDDYKYFTAPDATITATALIFRLTVTAGGTDSTDDITVIVRAAAGSPVTNLAAAPVTGTSSQIKVTWDAVDDATGYWVQWKSGTEAYDAYLRHDEVAATATSHTIYSLSKVTPYTIRMIALNADGFASQPSAEATATTLDLQPGYVDPPGRVRQLLLWPENTLLPYRFSLGWWAPVGADLSTYYYVQWKSGKQDYDASRQKIMPTASCTNYSGSYFCELIIDGLDSDTEYKFRAFSVKGSFDTATNQFVPNSDTSGPSPEFDITTPPWPLDTPTNVTATPQCHLHPAWTGTPWTLAP